jgi:DNA-binding HxlR family transcriptional regulator
MAARGGAATAARPRAGAATGNAAAPTGGDTTRHPCCALYHRAVELVGKRWTGAILLVLLDGPAHFSEIRALVPEISDRLLSERLKELEAEAIVERKVLDGSPVRVEYAMTDKGRALEPTVHALKSWANQWLDRSSE